MTKKSKPKNLPLFQGFYQKSTQKNQTIITKKPERIKKQPKNNKNQKSVKNMIRKPIVDKKVFIEVKNKKVYTVSEFLKHINQKFGQSEFKIKGEIGRVQIRGTYGFFTIKDKDRESILNCFVWKRVLDVCSIELEEGLEVLVQGFLEVYERTGNLNLQIKSIEPVGEGALKKAFEELKAKLEKQGLFQAKIKSKIPKFPQKIALITSKHGQAINDFTSNIGQFGFKIDFLDARVEGQRAVFDLLKAVRAFNQAKAQYDVLVLIRGGGSWESLQAFNNEKLALEIRKSKIPVICGVGHEGDVTIADLICDWRSSTPTAAAKKISENWSKAQEQLTNYESEIFNEYDYWLSQTRNQLNRYASGLDKNFSLVLEKFHEVKNGFLRSFDKLGYAIASQKQEVSKEQDLLLKNFQTQISQVHEIIKYADFQIKTSDPKRQLKLGYSLVYKKNRLVKKADQLKANDRLKIKFDQGKAESVVKSISNE
ncbi:MAG: exodeoxyribonuclease VII large subunit [Candidatus Moranbacteria bacterium]|nr:exodeoxyribonuclease VII large subunit [Candidatus Moranbacteria bacterium]